MRSYWFVKRWRNAAGVDEQLIAEKTGHRSSSVRAYKRTSDEQQQWLSEFYMEVIVERKKFKKSRKKKRKRARFVLN